MAAGSEVSRLLEKSLLPGDFNQAMLGSLSPLQKLGIGIEAGQNLALYRDMIGTFETRNSLLGKFNHIQDLIGASELCRIQSQHEAMMERITGSLSPNFLSRHKELLEPFSGMNARMEELTKSLQRPILSELMPPLDSVTEQVFRMAGPLHMASDRARELAEQLGLITKPWSTIGNEHTSIAAALRLSQFATFSRELPAFSKARTALKTMEFGQFDQVSPTAEAIEVDEEGEAIYTKAGRNTALVAFPSETFSEVLTATGWDLAIEPPPFIRPDGTQLPQAYIDAHDHFIINMIEAHLKAMIAARLIASGDMAAMASLFGHRISAWEEKRAAALKKNEPELHLIYYADFMELSEIVTNKVLWETTYKNVFQRKDRFKMTMERLHGLRVATAHSRPLTRTGKLRLKAEAFEFFEAIGIIPNI